MEVMLGLKTDLGNGEVVARARFIDSILMFNN